jgi:hypothetical protein
MGTKPGPPLAFSSESDFRMYVVARLAILETKMSFISVISSAALGSVLAAIVVVLTRLR